MQRQVLNSLRVPFEEGELVAPLPREVHTHRLSIYSQHAALHLQVGSSCTAHLVGFVAEFQVLRLALLQEHQKVSHDLHWPRGAEKLSLFPSVVIGVKRLQGQDDICESLLIFKLLRVALTSANLTSARCGGGLLGTLGSLLLLLFLDHLVNPGLALGEFLA